MLVLIKPPLPISCFPLLGKVLIVDLDYFFSWGLLVEPKFMSTNIEFKLMLGWFLTILALS